MDIARLEAVSEYVHSQALERLDGANALALGVHEFIDTLMQLLDAFVTIVVIPAQKAAEEYVFNPVAQRVYWLHSVVTFVMYWSPIIATLVAIGPQGILALVNLFILFAQTVRQVACFVYGCARRRRRCEVCV